MFSRLFNKIVSSIVLLCFSIMTLTTSVEAMAASTTWIAPPSGELPTWATHAADSNNWITMPNNQGFGYMTNYFPKDNFEQIGSMTWHPDPEDATKASLRWKMLDAEKWMRYGREDIGMNGIPSSLISDKINQFPKTSSYVFANYSPDTAELIIEVQKIEKNPNGSLAVFRADFTPWHGEFNKWKRDYLTFSEASNPAQMGYNPFEKFKGTDKTDHVFHNISWEAASVAIGEAMKRYDAHIGWVASDKTRITQRVKKSGGALRKKVTIYIDGWAKPQWFVAMPLGHQPQGGMSAICVTSIGATNSYGSTQTCDAKEHVAISGISMQAWEGGNMPENEEKVYAFKKSKSSFTVIAFTIITFAFTWGLAAAMSGVIGTAFGGISSAAVGAIGAGIYAGVALLNGAGLTTAQSSWAGSTGNGVLNFSTAGMDKHQKGLIEGVRNKQIYSRIGTGLEGAKQLYSGNCDESWSVAQCQAAGLDPGTMHRADAYSETNTTLILADEKTKCEAAVSPTDKLLAKNDPVFAEALRKQIQQCAAPKNGTWNTGW